MVGCHLGLFAACDHTGQFDHFGKIGFIFNTWVFKPIMKERITELK